MKNLGFGILVVLLAFPAFGEEQDDPVNLSYSAELLLGTAKNETSLDERTTWNRVFTSKNTALSTGLRGVASTSENFAFELAYQRYGDNDEDFSFGSTQVTQSISTSAINAGLKVSYLIGDFSAFVRSGIAFWRVNAEVNLSEFAGGAGDADDGRNFYNGLGLQYRFNPNFSLAAEYTVTSMEVRLGGFSEVTHKIQNLSAAFGYHF